MWRPDRIPWACATFHQHPSFTPPSQALSPVRRHHQRVVGMSVCVWGISCWKKYVRAHHWETKNTKMGVFVCMKKQKRNLRLVLMWWIFPKVLKCAGIPQGSSSGPLHFLLHRAFSLFWCPLQSLYSPGLAPELPPGPPPGPDWILLLQKALIYESRAPSLRHAAVCRQEKGSCASHGVCFTGESHALANQRAQNWTLWLTGVNVVAKTSWGATCYTVFNKTNGE